MKQLTSSQIRVIILLLDEKGHPLWELNKLLGRDETERGNLQKSIGKLQNNGLVFKDGSRKTTNLNSSRPNMQELPYYLSKDTDVFNTILKYLTKNDDGYNSLEYFLKSEYTNSVIKEQSFSVVHQMIQNELAREDIKLIASETLLNQPATNNEYKQLADKVDKSSTGKISPSEELHIIEMEVMPKFAEQIGILRDFRKLEAVRLYRETLHEGILKAFELFADRNLITKGLRNFMVWDNYLSPLSSYPVNGTSQLLFSQPFQRIYEEAYLLDGEKIGILSDRAWAIYSNFPDILFELFNVDRPTYEERELITKEMIFHWNVACTRFDRVCSCLAELYDKGNGSGNYHLVSDGVTFNIIDLQNNKPLLATDIAKNILKDGAVPMIFDETKEGNHEIMKDPWDYLRPSVTFKGFGLGSEYIPMNRILSQLESKLAEHDKGSS
jgi:hypothetical protein